MGRGAHQATVYGVAKELDTTEHTAEREREREREKERELLKPMRVPHERLFQTLIGKFLNLAYCALANDLMQKMSGFNAQYVNLQTQSPFSEKDPHPQRLIFLRPSALPPLEKKLYCSLFGCVRGHCPSYRKQVWETNSFLMKCQSTFLFGVPSSPLLPELSHAVTPRPSGSKSGCFLVLLRAS